MAVLKSRRQPIKSPASVQDKACLVFSLNPAGSGSGSGSDVPGPDSRTPLLGLRQDWATQRNCEYTVLFSTVNAVLHSFVSQVLSVLFSQISQVIDYLTTGSRVCGKSSLLVGTGRGLEGVPSNTLPHRSLGCRPPLPSACFCSLASPLFSPSVAHCSPGGWVALAFAFFFAVARCAEPPDPP